MVLSDAALASTQPQKEGQFKKEKNLYSSEALYKEQAEKGERLC